MDYTFLFIAILMLLAVKSNMTWIAVGLFALLLISSKNKYLLIAAVISVVVMFVFRSNQFEEYGMWIVIGGLFLVMLVLTRKEADQPSPQGYYGG
ncbi:MAG: hypothetical protein V1834_00745 [Candidatus Micrarchaeota archaeon]